MPPRIGPEPPLGSHEWLRTFRSQAPWKRLRAQVKREEPTCWLRLPGCTTVTTTADHIIPASQQPELALVRSNVHGACHNCNSRRADKHAFDPGLRRPKPPTTTTAAIRHVAGRRRRPRALQFFNASNPPRARASTHHPLPNNGAPQFQNGQFKPNNGSRPTKQWHATAPNSEPIRNAILK